MTPVDIITKKKNGHALTDEEIRFFVDGAVDGGFESYQLSALLMAICLRGMDERETVALTMAMARSGEMLDLSEIEGITVDKHSTGGVGDTTTLILAPLVAAAGAKVAKMSGRGLGHTGGTLDKLESIPGFRVELSRDELIHQVNALGLAVVGQTKDLAPADKTLYALRDVTGTVDSMPLIASSILSKKLASGAQCVVLDVKSGSGALMPTLDQSIELARLMVRVGNRAGRRFSALVTDMDQPLGNFIGNALEVEEAVCVLRGEITGPLLDVSLRLGAGMLEAAKIVNTTDEGAALLREKIADGSGVERLCRMVSAQGGDPRVIEDPQRLVKAKETLVLRAERSGVVYAMRTADLGDAARALGAGRYRKQDAIDPAAGIVMHRRIGDRVEVGQPLMTLHLGARAQVQAACALAQGAVSIREEPPVKTPLIFAEIGAED